METIGVLIWLFLPIGANMAPVVAKKIPALSTFTKPLDFGRSFRGKRIFGDNKTFRGLLSGAIFGAIVGFLQFLLANNFTFFADITSFIDYRSIEAVLFGGIIGTAALLGDAAESFVKRQLGKSPGESWFPFDQLDFVIGAFVASLLFFRLPLEYYVFGIFITLVLHPSVKFVGWLIGLEDKPF